MESYDITLDGMPGILYVDANKLTLDIEDKRILDSDAILSVNMVGTERIRIVWESTDERKSVLIRVTSAPAIAACELITSSCL